MVEMSAPGRSFGCPLFLATCCKQKCQINIKFFVRIIIIVPCHYCSSVHGKINLDFFSTNHHGYQLFCSSSFFVTQKDALTSHLDKLKRFVK